MSQIVEHTGIVNNIQNNLIQVIIIHQSACADCDAKGACRIIDHPEKMVDVESSDTSFLIGDKVILSCRKSIEHKAVFLAFVVPILLVLFTLILLQSVISKEAISGMISLSVLLPYYIILSFFKIRLKSKFKFEIRKYPTE